MSGYGTPEVVATGLRFPEGPVAMDDGSVLLPEAARRLKALFLEAEGLTPRQPQSAAPRLGSISTLAPVERWAYSAIASGCSAPASDTVRV